MCLKSVGIPQNMYQKTVRIHKCVKIVSTCHTIMCQYSVIIPLSDTFQTRFGHQKQRSLGNIISKKTVGILSQVNI